MSSLASALEILRCFSEDTRDLGVTEVAERLGMPKSSVSRWMKVMGEAGLLEQDEARRTYRPGPLAFHLGNLYQRHLKVLDLVDESIRELVESTGLTGYVAVLNGTDMVILQTRQGSYPVRLALEKGYRAPAFATAVGMALLARHDDADLRRMHPAQMHHDVTGYTRSVDEVIAEARRIRKRGYAVASGATFAGFGAIGVAVESQSERQLLAMSLSFPNAGINKAQREEIASKLIEQAVRVGAKTGDRYWLDWAGGQAPAGPGRQGADSPENASGQPD